MKKLRMVGLVAVICVIGLGIVLGAWSGRSESIIRSGVKTARPAATAPAVPAETATADPNATPLPEMPEQMKFRFLFEHLATLKDKPTMLGRYQGKMEITDAAFSVLVQLAVEHEQQASSLDKQAQIIIDNIHAQYPRHLPPGVAPPVEPQELLDLRDQRDALALTFRDRVREQLGEEGFARFKQFLDEEFRPKLPIRNATPPNRPAIAQKEDK